MRVVPDSVRETHVSRLLFANDLVYKTKKPVRFDFLDFSTLEARAGACRREVELNRPLAHDVYLGVANVLTESGDVEPAVLMRRLPEERRLAHLVRRRDPGAAGHVRKVAHAIAAFHDGIERSSEASHAASCLVVRKRWDDNFRAIRRVAGSLLDQGDVARAEFLAHRYLDGRGPLFERRVLAGRAREGHGDLLAEDIWCLDDGPRILDCIEFDDSLRMGDALLDVAFLAMDLERLGSSHLADSFMTAYREFTGDTFPSSLSDHYVAHRATIRAKVACLTSPPSPERHALIDLALRRLERARVRLVLLGGPPGSGKSTVAEGLVAAEGWMLLRSDEVRKDLAGLPHTPHPEPSLDGGIYGPAMTHATYRELIRRAGALLQMGESVVLDASFGSSAHRAAAAREAVAHRADLVQLRCDAPQDLAEARLLARRPGASDATPDVARALAERAEPWPAARSIDTTRSIEESVREASAAAAEELEPALV